MHKIRKSFFGFLLAFSAFFGISAIDGVDAFEISKNLDIFISIFKEVNTYYVDKIDPSKMIRKGIDAMLEDLDPYTEYYSEAETETFRAETTGKYGGVGAVIVQRGEYVYIDEPYEDMPAYLAGLRIGDKIIEIDGKSMKGKNSEDVSKLLKGSAGTKTKITIMRMVEVGQEKKMEFEVTRGEIKLKSIPYSGMAAPGVGYIALRGFTEDCGQEVKDAFKKLKEKEKLNGIILDLRGNGGGLLNEAINVCNIFMNQDLEIVSTKGKVAEWNKTYRTQQRAEDLEIPIVVLTNGGSASASEIVSGAIQDYDRGVIIGGKTFGKGLVQQVRMLPYNTQLKVTTSKYYIPSGRCIQAINYAEKNPDGSVKKVPDSLKIAFKTKAGRKVYDGGGIDPDIKTKNEYIHDITMALMAKGIFAEFANEYVLKNPKPARSIDFKFTDAEFEKFIQYTKSKSFEYDSKLESSIKKLKEIAEEDKSYDIIKDQYNQLLNKVKESKQEQIRLNKKEIIEIVESEIIRRYFTRTSVIERSFVHDEDIKAAIRVLNNPSEYKEILSKK